MSQIVKCPCGTSLAVRPEFAGRDVGCPNCKRRLRMPGNVVQSGSARPVAAPQQPIPQQPVQGFQSTLPPQTGFKNSHDSDAGLVKIGLIAIAVVAVVVLGLAGLYTLQSILTAPDKPGANATARVERPVVVDPVVTNESSESGNGDSHKATLDTMSLADLIEVIEPCVVRIDVTSKEGASIGSGVYVGNNRVVTNYHVVQGGRSVKIRSSDGKESYSKGFYYADPLKDLAVIHVDSNELSLSTIDVAATLPRKGAPVAAFGSPLGFSFSATEGVVSSIRSGGEIQGVLKEMTGLDVYSLLGYSKDTTWIQMTAAISGGNSGGPLVDMTGKLVGINTWTNPQGQNLNFASTKDEVVLVLDKCRKVELRRFAKLPTRKIVMEFKPRPGNGVASNDRNDRNSRNIRSGRNGRPGLGTVPAPQDGGEFTIRVIGSEESAEMDKEKQAEKAQRQIESKGILTVVPAAGEQFEPSGEKGVARIFSTDGPIVDLGVSKDEKYISAVSRPGTVWLIDATTGKLIYKITSKYKLFRTAKIMSSPHQLVTGCDNRTFEDSLQFRDLKTGEVKFGVRSIAREGRTVEISQDERSVIFLGSIFAPTFLRRQASGEYGEVRLKSVPWGTKIRKVAFTSDNLHMLLGQSNGEVSAINFSGNVSEEVAGAKIHKGPIVALLTSKSEKKFLSASLDGMVRITDHSEAQWKHEVYGTQDSEVMAATWSKDEKYIAVSRANKTIEIFDVLTKAKVHTIATSVVCNQIKFFNNLSFIVAGGEGDAIRFYSVTP